MNIKYGFDSYEYGKSDFPLPECCPFCGKSVCFIPTYLGYNEENKTLTLLVTCPVCHKVSLYTYIQRNQSYDLGAIKLATNNHTFYLGDLLKLELEYKQLDFCLNLSHSKELVDYLKENYNDFFEVYKDATLINQLGFKKSSMMIYRRALEILVKEHLIREGLSRDEAVKLSLNESINKINDSEICTVMKSIKLIGNDFTHFDSHCSEKDQEDMLYFMDVVLSFFNKKRATIKAYRSTEKYKSLKKNRKSNQR